MKYIKLSDLLKREIKPFLLGAFINRIMETTIEEKHYFYAYTSFRASKYVYPCDFELEPYADELKEKFNWFGGYQNWSVHKANRNVIELRFYVLDDLNVTKKAFYKHLNKKLMSSDWLFDEGLTESKKSFMRGFIECRGSVDTSRPLIAQDYFYDDRVELKKVLLLTDMMDLPMEYANFNARDLQPQFVSGEVRRNTQFRVNSYFYANRIGFINDYKAQIFSNAYATRGSEIRDKITYFSLDLPLSSNSTAFINNLNFFTNNIYQRTLTESAVATLRKQRGFSSENDSNGGSRNKSIIDLYREISEDRCAICSTTETFTNKKTGRQHFEIHHVISYTNGQECDNIANLVKLCPTCHDMIKRGASDKNTQMGAIIKILSNHEEVREFAYSYFMSDDIIELAEMIWEHLG